MTPLGLDGLAYERRVLRVDLPEPSPVSRAPNLRAVVRSALDWETVTPLDDLPADTIADRLKKGLRRWRAGAGGRA